MRPFIGGRSRQWDQGETLLHVYVLPNLTANPEFADLVRRHHAILTGDNTNPGYTHLVSPVALDWLHATVQMIAHLWACHVNQEQRAALIALHQP